MNAIPDIDHLVDCRLIIAEATTMSVPSRWKWDATDPGAVKATFFAGGEAVEWVFSRDLVAAGTKAFAGEGDVRIWPDDDGTIGVSLTSPEGVARLTAPLAQLQSFLDATYERCAPGSIDESCRYTAALDAELAELLGEEAS